MQKHSQRLLGTVATLVSTIPSGMLRRLLAGKIYDRDSGAVIDALGSRIHGSMTLDGLRFDLEPTDHLEFEDLAGLFPSTPLAYGVTLMTPPQLAYLFGIARRSGARTGIEIGRYKGGTTITIAAGMGAGGTLWSIDNGSLEEALSNNPQPRRYDEQIRRLCDRFSLDVRLLVGDSRTMEIDVDAVDLVFVDGDHSYEGAKADLERWGRRVRVGGDLLMDDAFPLEGYGRHTDTVGQVVREAIATGDFRLAKAVDRLAHLVRTR